MTLADLDPTASPTADSTADPAPDADRWTFVCRYDDLIPDRGVAALVEGEQVAVFRLCDGSLHAVSNYCPRSGAYVIAQDEATSVVWGMPGAAANAGVCSAVLPLDIIAPKIVRLFAGEKP